MLLSSTLYVVFMNFAIPFAIGHGNPGWWFENIGRAQPSAFIYAQLVHSVGVVLAAAPISAVVVWRFRPQWVRMIAAVGIVGSMWMLSNVLRAAWILGDTFVAHFDAYSAVNVVIDTLKVGIIPLGLAALVCGVLPAHNDVR